jgi:hypothetical protein
VGWDVTKDEPTTIQDNQSSINDGELLETTQFDLLWFNSTLKTTIK